MPALVIRWPHASYLLVTAGWSHLHLWTPLQLIDHVFTRTAQAVPTARLAGTDPFRLATWRSGGYHVALSGVLPLVRFVALNSPAVQVHKAWDQSALLQLCKDPSSTVAVAIRQQVTSLLSPAQVFMGRIHSGEAGNRASLGLFTRAPAWWVGSALGCPTQVVRLCKIKQQLAFSG